MRTSSNEDLTSYLKETEKEIMLRQTLIDQQASNFDTTTRQSQTGNRVFKESEDSRRVFDTKPLFNDEYYNQKIQDNVSSNEKMKTLELSQISRQAPVNNLLGLDQ